MLSWTPRVFETGGRDEFPRGFRAHYRSLMAWLLFIRTLEFGLIGHSYYLHYEVGYGAVWSCKASQNH